MRGKVTTIKAMAMAALVAGCAASAGAQQFELQTNVTGRAGDTVSVDLFVQAPQDIAALNFTIAVGEDDDDENFVNGNITGDLVPLTGFAQMAHSPNTASSKEFRGVLYATTPGSVIPANTKTKIATVRVPLAANAADGRVIELKLKNSFAQDGVTGLLGISNTSGQSLVIGGSPATARPGKVDGSVIADPTFLNVDFNGPTLVAGWEAIQGIPDFVQVLPTLDGGADPDALRIRPAQEASAVAFKQQAKNGWAFLQTEGDPDSAVKAGAAGSVIIYSWTVASTSAVPGDFATTRIRMNAYDGSYSSLASFQEQEPGATPSAPVVVPVAGSPKVFRAAFTVDESINNNTQVGGDTANGVRPAFDVLNFNETDGILGRIGVDVVASNFQAISISPDQLGAGTQVLNYDFSGGDTQGFVATNSLLDPPGDDVDLLTTSSSDGGLGLTAIGNVVLNPAVGTYYLPFGFWSKTATEWTVQSNTLYRVQYTLSSTADNIANTPTFRLRLTAGQNDFVQEFQLESSSVDQTNYIPLAPAEKTYTSYVIFPEEVAAAGANVRIDFDIMGGTSPQDNGGFIVRDLRVDAVPLPGSF